MPCYNAEGTVAEAVNSILTQSFGHLELIAVDDGSTDDTLARLRQSRERDSRICVIEQDHLGIVAALENARSRAKGTIIARMDADDVALPGRLELQLRYLTDNPDIAACGTRIEYFPSDAVRDGARRYQGWINSVCGPGEIERDLFVECPIPHPTLMIRTSVLEAVGGYRDNGWPEDYDLVLRLWDNGHRLGKVPEVLLLWREDPDRLSRQDARYSEDAFRACKVQFIRRRISGRKVVIWGAGPVGKAFSRAIQAIGYELTAFVDLDPRKIGQEIHGVPVVHPDAIDPYREAYFLSAVGSHDARTEIRETLTEAGFVEVRDWCAVA